MKHIIPFIIIAASLMVFLTLKYIRPSKRTTVGMLRRVWRFVVSVWDFITNFG